MLENLSSELNKYRLKSQEKREITKQNNPNKINQIEAKLIKLKDLYLDNLIDKDTYSNDYRKYSAELEQLKQSEVVEEKKDFSKVEKIINSDYMTIYNKLSKENKRKFWLSFVDKIYVLDGEIKEVTFL